MEDLAAFTGLSRPTISKYFDDPALVRASIRAKLEAAIAASSYRPNMFASNLQRRGSKVLGVIIPDSTDPFYMELTRRLHNLADEVGLFAVVLSSSGSQTRQNDAITRLQSMNVMGMIVAPLAGDDTTARLEDMGAEIPIVYVDAAPNASAAFVGTDNTYSFGLMVDYLCRSGEPPCFMAMPPVNSNAAARRLAYARAMEALGHQPQILEMPQEKRWDFERFGYEQMARHLDAGLPRQTVLCANDRMAFGAQLCAWERGLEIGLHKALRIAGHDDHPLSQYACPPMTTVAQPFGEIAHLAMAQVLGHAARNASENWKGARIFLKSRLMLRSSA